MGKRRAKFGDQVRRAIRDSGLSLYRVSMETGISQSMLSRFMAGKMGISLDSLDKIGDLIGLKVSLDPAAATHKGR